MQILTDSEYNRLLDRAFSKMPKLAAETVDFIIPKADSFIQGNETIVKNIKEIADRARRKPTEISRYLSKELSVPVNAQEQRLVISGKFSADDINKRVQRFFEIYIICKECHKPDTHFESAGRGMLQIVCEACGARYGVKNY
ncbi:MAG: translation initiation factor IF-2 subunit beta [Candidatus Micrarchaeota archaeon]|nr:translation initiation factor IF-2 subunit beta [Candidatus Micrarchaeota archaeon]